MKAKTLKEYLGDQIWMNGGFTYRFDGKSLPESGYLVAIENLETGNNIECHKSTLDKALLKCSENPDLYFGGWQDSDTGTVYFDMNKHYEHLEAALLAAESLNELAIWDLKNKKEIRL